ncbi:MAG: Clp1/GlmU family protein, partial [Promethearchaeota archaeon]
MELNLKKNEAIKVIGPSKIEVSAGEIEIFGKKIRINQSIIVKKGKSFPIEAIKNSTLQINSESSENIKKIEGDTISNDRKELIEKILTLPKPCKILLIGAGDTGKTTFITLLANKCFEKGYKTAILDLDVGQHDIGPPCTISLGFLKDFIYDLKEVPIESLFFIGNTSPAGHIIRCLAGIGRLLENGLKADITLIDTSGWIKGNAARSYKTSKIELIKPNLIVGIQRDTEIEHLLKPFFEMISIYRLSVSKNIQARTFNDRRFLREVSFRNYFSNGQSRTFNCDEVNFAYTLYKTGNEPDENTLKSIEETLDLKSKYCELSNDGIFFVQGEEKF